MAGMHNRSAGIASIALSLSICGCASDPVVASAHAAHGLFYVAGEAAIVTGRTFFHMFGLGIETTPPSMSPPPAPTLPRNNASPFDPSLPR